MDDRLIKEVRTAPGRAGNPSVVETEIRQLEREHCLPSKLNIEENEDADFWLQLPRTFSYQSARLLIFAIFLFGNQLPREYQKMMQYSIIKLMSTIKSIPNYA